MGLAKTLFASLVFLSTALPLSAGQNSRLRTTVMKLARQAVQIAQAKGFGKKELLTVIDYSLPSTAKRLWVLDLKHSAFLAE